jgi:hypothetical protein
LLVEQVVVEQLSQQQELVVLVVVVELAVLVVVAQVVQVVVELAVLVVVTKNAVKNTEPMIQNIVNGTVVIEVFDFDRLNTHPTNGCCIGTHHPKTNPRVLDGLHDCNNT